MLLSTMLNIYSSRREGNSPELMIRGIDLCKVAGFDAVDFSLSEVQRAIPEAYAQDAWAERALEALASSGMPVSQGHAYMLNTRTLDDEGEQMYFAQVKRSVELAGRLGIRWLAFHAICRPEEPAASDERNVRMLHSLENTLEKHNVGLALENLFNTTYENAQGLLRLANAADNPARVGFCWDTGHANLVSGMDQASSIRSLGKRLRCTHIQDNHGERDEHILPYMGTIEWPPIVRALRESGYDGAFNYEAAQPLRHLPADDVLRIDMMRYAAKLGRYLLALA